MRAIGSMLIVFLLGLAALSAFVDRYDVASNCFLAIIALVAIELRSERK
jgi:hypothetical protein